MSENVSTKQPKALYMLFFAEMWERFSFYGMRALLILYMTQRLLYDDDFSVGIYAAYGALVYATPFIGGIIADNILGYRKSVIFGGLLMTIGHFIMAFEHEYTFYGALAFLILGNGFFKPNVSSLVGGLYKDGDARRDGGFTIFYMGINLGAFLAPLLCGIIGEGFGWHYGFGLAGIGMLLGLIVFWRGQEQLGDTNGLPPANGNIDKKFMGISYEYVIYIASFLLVPVFALLVNHSHVAEYLNLVIAAVAIGILAFLSFTQFKGVEQQRIWVILILVFFSTLFWAFFEQAGSSINLYTARNVDRSFFGIDLPASIFQSVNPLFIIVLAPLFASMWIRLKKVNKEPSTPLKFVLGILQLGLGFFVLVWGASSAGVDGKSPLIFLVLGYLLHTMGELCLSPVGLSMVTKLSPKKIVAMTMGVWFISSSLAHIVGGVVAKETSTSSYKINTLNYFPEIGQTESTSFKLRLHDDGTSFEKDGETKYKDTLYTNDVVVNIKVDENVAEASYGSQAPTSTVYRKYVSLQKGKEEKIPARVNYIDPTGKKSNLVVENLPANIAYNNETFTIKAEGGDAQNYGYRMCDKKTGECTDVELVLTVDEAENHEPTIAINTLDITIPKRGYFSKFLGKASAEVPVIDFANDIDGDGLSIEVLEKPTKGYLNKSKKLHPFATADRMINKYSNVFSLVGFICLGAAVVLLLLSPLLRKWMNGID